MDINQVHVDAVLTNIAIEFATPGFVANQVSPFVPVNKESDKYYRFLKREELSSESAKSLRAPGAEAHEIEWEADTDVYSCDEHAFRHLLPDRVRDNADAPIRPRARITRKITAKLWLGFEERVQAIAQSASRPGAAVTTKWNAVGAYPERDVDAAKEEMRRQCGQKPSHMLLSGPAARILRQWLKDNTSALTLEQRTSFTELPEKVFGVRPIEAESIHNTANIGQAVQTIADVWDDTVCMLYIDTDPGLDSFTFMLSFQRQNLVLKTWRKEERKGEMQEGSWILTEKLIVDEACYQLRDVL